MAGKIFEEFRANVPGFVPEPRIEGRLTTTGLIGVVFHFHPGPLQHFHHIESRLGKQLIHEAWYE
jgi:hypothetical protein